MKNLHFIAQSDISGILPAIISLVLSFFIMAAGILISQVWAQSPSIQYPVAELGDCQDKTACKTYCDQPKNIEACLIFAQSNNLMSAKEIQVAQKFAAAGGKGPGGCQTQDECKTYCDDINRIEECVAFAEENNLLPPAELEEVKKIKTALARGIKPPSCGSKKSCDEYCDNPDHTEECITFAEAAGFLQGKELEDAKKMLQALKRGVKPPPCRGKEACDQYCSAPDNMELCMTFALEAGFMTEQEKADSQKMLQALKKGFKPPPCQGKDECDIYCSQEEHFEECMNFAEAAGFMTAEEATMARKTKGKGAGGCKSKDECEAFCNNPDNQETCFNFAKENGLISEQDLRQMEEAKQKFRESLNQAPPAVLDCLNSVLGNDMMEKLKSGSALPPREVGDQMRSCYEKIQPPPGQGMDQGQTGPGGCKDPEECRAYCESNPEECKNLPSGPDGSGGGQNGNSFAPGTIPAGPGGCANAQECQSFCENNPQECQPPGGPVMPVESGPPGGQPGGFVPPPGQQGPGPEGFPPPTGSFQNPPEGFPPPPANQFPPQEPPANLPGGFLGPNSLFGSIIHILLGK